MNEAQVRERLRQAVGEVGYPAYLSSRIESLLKNPEPEERRRAFMRRGQNRRRMRIGNTGSLVAALVALLLIAALMVGVYAWRNNQLPTRPVPAGELIKRYQALMSTDQLRFDSTSTDHCTTLDDATCLDAQATITADVMHWLDDLNHTTPPARFVAVDALIRRHLALRLQDNIATVAAFRTRGQKAFDTSVAAGHVERAMLHRLAGDIIASSQGTVAFYTAFVQLDESYLLDCVLCQRLVSPTLVSCQVSQASVCSDEIDAIRVQVEGFLGDMVLQYAPDSLAVNEALLQADLLTAERELDAMAAALSAGDPVALSAGHAALRLALTHVQSDAADIARST